MNWNVFVCIKFKYFSENIAVQYHPVYINLHESYIPLYGISSFWKYMNIKFARTVKIFVVLTDDFAFMLEFICNVRNIYIQFCFGSIIFIYTYMPLDFCWWHLSLMCVVSTFMKFRDYPHAANSIQLGTCIYNIYSGSIACIDSSSFPFLAFNLECLNTRVAVLFVRNSKLL